MRQSLRVAVFGIVAATILGSAILAVAVRTYAVREYAQRAFVMWNDEQLVLFVQRLSIGTSATVMQQLIAPIANRAGLHVFPGRSRVGSRVTIIRVEHGAVLPTNLPATTQAQLLLGIGPRLRFFKGRPLVGGGFWNGSGVDPIETDQYLRLTSARGPDDMGPWHSGVLLAPGGALELRVRMHDEAFMLRGTRRGGHATIDLVRDGEAPAPLFEGREAAWAVSGHEYESGFAGAKER